MNTGRVLGFLAILFGVLTIITAIYAVATRGNAGATVVLMVITLMILAVYRGRTR